MRASSILTAVSAFAAVAYAQSSDSCDPQNDNNNDATCSGTATSSSLTGRESLVTITTSDIVVLTSTDVGNSVFTTTLPKSLRTFVSTVAQDTTLVPVVTPSVISGVTTIVATIPTTSGTSTGVVTRTTVSSATVASSTNAAGSNAVPYVVGGILAGVAALV